MYIMKEDMPEATRGSIFENMIVAAPEFSSFETNRYFGFTMAKGVPIDDIARENPGVQLITIGVTALPGLRETLRFRLFFSFLAKRAWE